MKAKRNSVHARETRPQIWARRVFSILLSLPLLFSSAAGEQPVNLVMNPGFESGTNGWTFIGNSGWHILSPGNPAHSGNAEAYVNIASGSVSQTIATTPGGLYLVKFWLSANGFSSFANITASFAGVTGFSRSYGPGAFGYVEHTFVVKATQSLSTFVFAGVMSGGTFFIDDVSIELIDPFPTIITETLPEARSGKLYERQLQSVGGLPPFTWSIGAGALPEGITLVGSGLLSGTPGTEGVYAFTVTVTAADGMQSEKSFQLNVLPPPVCVPPPLGGTAWWRFDEQAGSIASDSLGSNSGGHVNGPVIVDGLVRNALRFNGNNYVDVPDSELWTFGTNDFTIELWANFDTSGTGTPGEPGDILVGCDEGPGNRRKWFFALGGGVLEFVVGNPLSGGGFINLGAFRPVPQRWYHLAVLRRGHTFLCYVNGTLHGSAVSSITIPNPSAPLTIGQAEQIGFMNGIIDEVAIYHRSLTEEELQTIYDADRSGKCVDVSIRPGSGGDTGRTTVRVQGIAVTQNSTVKLRRDGEGDIVGEGLVIQTNSATLEVTFDLNGAALGQWDIVITNPGSLDLYLPLRFTVEKGKFAQLWSDAVGLPLIRAGRQQTYWLSFGNDGNTDVEGANLLVSVPVGTFAELSLDDLPPTIHDPNQISGGYKLSSAIFRVMVAKLAAGSTYLLPLKITSPSVSSLEIHTRILRPYDNSSANTGEESLRAAFAAASAQDSVPIEGQIWIAGNTYHAVIIIPEVDLQGEIVPNSYVLYSQVSRGNTDSDYLLKVKGTQVEVEAEIQKLLPNATPPHRGLRQIQTTQARTLIGKLDELTNGDWIHSEVFWKNPGILNRMNCVGVLEVAAERAGIDSGQGFVKSLDEKQYWVESPYLWAKAFGFQVPKYIAQKLNEEDARFASEESNGFAIGLKVLFVASFDPNDKVGAQGFGTQRYIPAVTPLVYTIWFENLETATAAAQEVVIRDQLNAAVMNLNTVSIGPITFGNKILTPPPGISSFVTDVDLRPRTNLLVRITVTLNRNTGVLTWRLTALDLATGDFPSDPKAGFLPPNVISPEGSGSVSFTVMPRADLPDGTEIRNRAEIVFDLNEPIITPEWLNTIDTSAPQSRVASMLSQQPNPTFMVQWFGSDERAGVKAFSIYVSEDGGPFMLWLEDTVETSAVFQGVGGRNYRFFSVAKDHVGNLESKPDEADATTTVMTQDMTPPTVLISNCPERVNLNAPATATVTVSDSDSGIAMQSAPNGFNLLVTSTLGLHTFTVIAQDNAGNLTTNECGYEVIYDFAALASLTGFTDGNCHAAIPDFRAQLGMTNGVMLSQSPTAGTLVGNGTHPIVMTVTDQANHNQMATTTFTVIPVPSFTLSITPGSIKRGGKVAITATYRNCAANRQTVTLKLSLTRAGVKTALTTFPVTLNAGQTGTLSTSVTIPKSTPPGPYTLTLDVYMSDVLVGASSASLIVTE
jgi:hypothetical protein